MRPCQMVLMLQWWISQSADIYCQTHPKVHPSQACLKFHKMHPNLFQNSLQKGKHITFESLINKVWKVNKRYLGWTMYNGIEIVWTPVKKSYNFFYSKAYERRVRRKFISIVEMHLYFMTSITRQDILNKAYRLHTT